MIELTYNNMRHYGLSKERTKEEDDLINRQIGGKGSYSWNKKDFELSAMQMAIIDILYDAGKDKTFSSKHMLNRKTREACLLDRDWVVTNVHNRKQTSCGHDEVEYEIYLLYDFDPKTNERTTVYEGKQGEKYADTTELSEAADELRDEHVALGGSERWAHRYSEETTYKGKCAWDNKRHSGTNLPCKHHGATASEPVMGQYKHRETGHIRQSLYNTGYYSRHITDADAYDLLIWDEQDHAEFLKGVDDSEVLDAIKYAIRQMKTESRPWLESNYQDYNQETKEWEFKGKRGHYRLSWWSSIEAEEKTKVLTEINIAKAGEVNNGWTFTISGSNSYNQPRVVSGDWQGTVTVYGVKGSEYYDKDTVFTQEIYWQTKEEASLVCKLLNSRTRITSHYHDYEPSDKATVYEKECAVGLGDIHASICNLYTPKQYYKMCHNGLLGQQYNMECTHTHTGSEEE